MKPSTILKSRAIFVSTLFLAFILKPPLSRAEPASTEAKAEGVQVAAQQMPKASETKKEEDVSWKAWQLLRMSPWILKTRIYRMC